MVAAGCGDLKGQPCLRLARHIDQIRPGHGCGAVPGRPVGSDRDGRLIIQGHLVRVRAKGQSHPGQGRVPDYFRAWYEPGLG